MKTKFHPYGYTLSNDPEKAIPEVGVKIRKKLNPLIQKVLLKINERPNVLVRDGRNIRNQDPKIYIATHAFLEDVVNSLIAMGEDGYILAGNLDVYLHTFNGFATWVCGPVAIDRMDPESRKSSVDKMKRVLDLGSNILLFPEGTWDLSTNKLMNGLYGGFYDLAMKTGYPVVPIVTFEDGKNCYTTIGKELYLDKLDDETYENIFSYIENCLNRACDFPIEGYENYKQLSGLLTDLKHLIEKLIEKKEDKTQDKEEIINNIAAITQEFIEENKIILNKVDEDSIEYSIIKRINVYLKSIVNARKTVVVEEIRNYMGSEKYHLLEQVGEKRERHADTTLEEDVAAEKEFLIKKAGYWNYEEEEKSIYEDPISRYDNDPIVKKLIKK